MTEDVRLGTGGKIARRCACKGWIVADETMTPNTIQQVITHQSEEPHKSWSRADWIEANTAKVKVPSATLRRVA